MWTSPPLIYWNAPYKKLAILGQRRFFWPRSLIFIRSILIYYGRGNKHLQTWEFSTMCVKMTVKPPFYNILLLLEMIHRLRKFRYLPINWLLSLSLSCIAEMKKKILKKKCNYYCIYLLNESQARYLKETIYLCLFLNFGDEKVWAALCINRVHL